MATVASARYSIPHGAPVANSPTNPDKTSDGRHDSTSPARDQRAPSPVDMRASFNPDARCFTPGGQNNIPHEHFDGFQGQYALPFPPPHAPPAFQTNFAPPFCRDNQHAYQESQAQEQTNVHAHIHAHVHSRPQPWSQPPPYGFPAHQGQRYGLPPLPFNMPPYGFPPILPHFDRPPPFAFAPPPQHFPQRANHNIATQAHMNMPYGGAGHEDVQYAFDALFQKLKKNNRRTNARDSAFAIPDKRSKFGPMAKGQGKNKEYSSLASIHLHGAVDSRVDKSRRTSPGPKNSTTSKKGRYGDNKIMLPAPQPTAEYIAQATEPPEFIDTPNNILVILDLNGTLLFRPNKNAKTMIERPFLKPFLRYLFQNFKVMVWSSAKPENVKALVSQSLDNSLKSQLVAQWARDSFGLSPTNYGQNVQVYKNLKLVWSRDVIQQHHPEYASGGRFGQHNTVLIDDSVLKANAQPFNLLEIPEFSATPEQMDGDVLREVAGYLEILKQQADVSKFMNQTPFEGDGRWGYEWSDDIAGGGEMTSKASTKKNKKKLKKRDEVAAPVAEAVESMSNISLVASANKDW